MEEPAIGEENDEQPQEEEDPEMEPLFFRLPLREIENVLRAIENID